MNQATYSPEDNKLRLYVGRVPRDEYEKLRAEGWISTPKQNCDFVATWDPIRRNTCLDYADIIEDEDQGPSERAADRAERFGEYRDKRTDEATGHADRYDAGPSAHGYQSATRAERAARRHDRIATHATDAWSKAEYWQQRTAGVIAHALYKSTPGVRMGRIKILEAQLRKHDSEVADRIKRYEAWKQVEAMTDLEKQTQAARALANYGHYWSDYSHPVSGLKRSLSSMLTDEEHPITGAQACAFFFSDHGLPSTENDWSRHYTLRLAYENQMLQAEGGRAAFVEMEVGGWIGQHQIRKVNKSNATGRVVSVAIMHPRGFSGFTRESGYKEHVTRPAVVIMNIERFKADVYRPPTAEDLAALAATIKAEKAKAPKKVTIPLINPTDADAERLQALWNDRARARQEARSDAKYCNPFEPKPLLRITQAVYSANAQGAYARAETRDLCRNGELWSRNSNMYSSEATKRENRIGPAVCKIRIAGYDPHQVIVLTDKPQKSLPQEVWQTFTAPIQHELVTV